MLDRFFDRFIAIHKPIFRCECGDLVTDKNETEHLGPTHKMRVCRRGSFVEWVKLKVGIL